MSKCMASIKKLIVIFLVAVIAVGICTTINVNAASSGVGLPKAVDNLGVNLRIKSEIVATTNGYMRVFYDGTKIRIENYDNNFNILSKKSLNMELKIWGGFYAGTDGYYYIVEGQNNTAESNTAEVIRVIKYDTNWNRKGAATITSNPDLFGGEVRYPFDYGCVEMSEYNGKLYVVTGHEGYVDPKVGQGHQGFLMIEVDKATMKGEIAACDLWHSFAQYIDTKDSYLYVLEQSEGSRYTKLSRYKVNNELECTSFPVLEYGGTSTSPWAIACYASVDGMAISSGNVLCLGTSIDQSKYNKVTENTPHNIYLTVTPMANFSESATTVKWLTNYKSGGKSFLGTKITRINDNRFLVTWEEFETGQKASANDTLSGSILHYVFVDGQGNKLGNEFTAAAPISECQPIVKNSKVIYYASNANMVNFYTIDANTGAFSKKSYRVAGDNATWKINNGVLTISGSGTMNINTDADATFRDPVSSVSGRFFYSDRDNAWAPVRDNVKKITINTGITSISAEAFKYFGKLEEVNIKSGLKSIGKKAFCSCHNLKKVTIPASVTNIGDDILWTGETWVGSGGHVVDATIYGYKGSYAETYAKKNKIDFVTLKPKYTVKLNANGGKKLSKSSISVSKGNKIGTLPKPTRSGYKFLGWYNKKSGGTMVTSKTKITSNRTIYAHWASAYTLKFNANGGKKLSSSSLMVVKNKAAGKLPTAGKKGYALKGWYTKKTGGSKVTTKTKIKKNQTLYAHWSKITVKKASKPTVKSAGSRKISVKIKKVTGANGYQIVYSKSSKFKSAKNVTTTSITKKLSKLTKGKTYYVKVRAYKKDSLGYRIYGKESNVAKIKVK